MSIEVDFISGVSGKEASAIYDRDTCTLEYRHTFASLPETSFDKYFEFRPERYFVIVGELVLSFANRDKLLCGFDAHINRSSWQATAGFSPDIDSDLGCVALALPMTDDRIQVDIVPEYFFSAEDGTLRIRLSDEHPTQFVRCSERLVLGCRGGVLTDLLIVRLEIR